MTSASKSPIGRILVVDDNAQNRKIAEAQLVAAGYAVSEAETGEQALAMFAEQAPDLILLDVLMPGLDGFETCKRLRALRGGGDVAIVFLTALNDLGSHEKALASGADDFLSKPINRTELLIRARSLLWVKRLKDELKQGYDLIRSQRDALLTVQRQKEELSAMLVHDLKNPLTSIMVCAELLVKAAVDDDQRGSAEDIFDAAQSMNRMVMNLLDISRSEDGALAPRWAELNVPLLLEDVRCVAQRRARQTLRVETAPPVKTIEADVDLVRRLVENLIDNAIKYATTGSEIRMAATSADPDWIEIRCSDDGPGVPDAYKRRIFEKYVQLDRDAASVRSSRGLGLTFCRLAAELHGGSIWIEDNKPAGSIFCVKLPVRRF